VITLSGQDVLIGGNFTFLKYSARSYLAYVDKVSGLTGTWNPGADYIVYGIACNTNRVYVVGSFDNIGGISRTGAAAFLLSNLNLDSWNA
jgi:hypothetical protein